MPITITLFGGLFGFIAKATQILSTLSGQSFYVSEINPWMWDTTCMHTKRLALLYKDMHGVPYLSGNGFSPLSHCSLLFKLL